MPVASEEVGNLSDSVNTTGVDTSENQGGQSADQPGIASGSEVVDSVPVRSC